MVHEPLMWCVIASLYLLFGASCVHLFPTPHSVKTFVAWNPPRWGYLHHGNWRMLHVRAFFFSFLSGEPVYQHTIKNFLYSRDSTLVYLIFTTLKWVTLFRFNMRKLRHRKLKQLATHNIIIKRWGQDLKPGSHILEPARWALHCLAKH